MPSTLLARWWRIINMANTPRAGNVISLEKAYVFPVFGHRIRSSGHKKMTKTSRKVVNAILVNTCLINQWLCCALMNQLFVAAEHFSHMPFPSLYLLMTLAGTPAATQKSGISRVTTLPAAITQ